MSHLELTDDVSLSSAIIAQMDDACDRFETAWKGGSRPRLEEYLGESTDPEQSALLCDLLELELVYRRYYGESLVPEEYLTRFPEYVDLVDKVLSRCESSTDDREPTTDRASEIPHTLPLQTRATAAGTVTASAADDEDTVPWNERELVPTISGYKISKTLGRGGMGVVYLATQLALKRPVALKMIRADSQVEPSQLRRFRVEAEAVARLRHPNVVQIYEVGEAGGAPYLSLELLEGGSLADRLAGAPMAPRKRPRWRSPSPAP